MSEEEKYEVVVEDSKEYYQLFKDDPAKCLMCQFERENPERELRCPKHNIIRRMNSR